MRIPLVMAPALVLAVGVVVGLASLGAGTDDDPAVEPSTVRAPTVSEPGAPGAAPLVPAAPPQRHSPAEPAPRDPAAAADDDDDDAVDDRADDDKVDDDKVDNDKADDDD